MIGNKYKCVAEFMSKASVNIIDDIDAQMIDYHKMDNPLERFWVMEGLKRIQRVVRDEWCKCERCVADTNRQADYEQKHYEIRKRMNNKEITEGQATVLFNKLMQESIKD